MKQIIRHYNGFFSHPPSLKSAATAIIFLLISLVINFYASQYAYVSKGNPVPDILLDNLPVIDMSVTFVAGTTAFVIFLVIFLLARPYRMPFTLKAMSLFIVVRSFFITLTHLGPSPLNTLSAPGEIARAFTSGADLFFSGHTGMPFLFALMYWHDKVLRSIFLIVSVLAGAAVLFGHIHYSIDVASAFFITYGIYKIARKIFKKDLVQFEAKYD